MRATFSLSNQDYKRLEQAIARRLQHARGRLHLPFFVQVLAWMFITLAVMTYYKQWERTPAEAAPYGVILLFAVLSFVFATVLPLAARRLYWKYLFASNASFTVTQSVEIVGTWIVTESPVARSQITRSAVIDHSEDGHNHYLFVTGVQAIIIPKQAAASLGSAFTEFLALPRSEV
jgi:uncharacterized membrane protein (DUF485 family)